MTRMDDELRWQAQGDCVEFTLHSYGGWKPVYPFDEMGKGDFFLLHTPDAAKKARHAAQNYCRKNDLSKFTVVRTNLDTWVCRKVM